MGTLVSCAHVPISAVFRGGTFLLEQPRSGPVLVSPALGSRLTKLAHTDPSLEGNGVPAHTANGLLFKVNYFFQKEVGLTDCCPLPLFFLPLCCLVDVAWRGSLVGSVGQGFAEASNEGK